MPRATIILLFLSMWLVLLVHFNPNRDGTDRYVFLTMSMVERHSLNIDPYAHLTNDYVVSRGHSYSDANPGISMAAVPMWAAVYAVYKHIRPSSSLRSINVHFFLADFVSTAFTSSLAGAFTAVLLAMLIYNRTLNTAVAIFTAIVYSFGSIAFFFSCRMNQNVVIAALMLAIYTLVFAPQVLSVSSERVRLALIGLLMGMAILTDLPSIPIIIVFAVYAVRSSKRASSILWGVAVGAIPIGVLMIYQWAAFHNPILPPQAHFSSGLGDAVHSRGMMGIVAPNPHYLISMLISPDVGLFVYMPFTLISVWALAANRVQSPILSRQERTAIILACLAQLLFISGSLTIQTLFGPRYLLQFVPLLCLVYGLYLGSPIRHRLLHLYTIGVLTGIGFLVNIAGAQIGINTNNVLSITGVWLLRGPWLPILDWIKLNLTAITGHDPALITPYGLLCVLACTLVTIWMPHLILIRGINKNIEYQVDGLMPLDACDIDVDPVLTNRVSEIAE